MKSIVPYSSIPLPLSNPCIILGLDYNQSTVIAEWLQQQQHKIMILNLLVHARQKLPYGFHQVQLNPLEVANSLTLTRWWNNANVCYA
jgi:hypothetical protein